MTAGKLQTKDIPDQVFLDLIDRLWNVPRSYANPDGKLVFFYPNGASLFDICKLWDHLPQKLILAKLRNLEKKKLIDGCTCGCRGDFTVNREEAYIVESYLEEATGIVTNRFLPRTSRALRQGCPPNSTGH